MKKFFGNVTDWIGWFFVEVGDKMFWLTNGNWAWREDGENVRWFLRPYFWLAGSTYSLGHWFYGVFDDCATGWNEPFSKHHGSSALDLASRINDITDEMLERFDECHEEDKALDADDLKRWQSLVEEMHWLSHEFE